MPASALGLLEAGTHDPSPLKLYIWELSTETAWQRQKLFNRDATITMHGSNDDSHGHDGA